jgi:hypothetical protein
LEQQLLSVLLPRKDAGTACTPLRLAVCHRR